MNDKATTKVTIGGKTYNLSGFESEDYLLEVASYIDGKIAEVSSYEGINRLTADLQILMTEINIADDYFKARAEAERQAASTEALSKELYELKQRLVDLEMKGKNDGTKDSMLRSQNEAFAKDLKEKDKRIRELEKDKERLKKDLEELLLDDKDHS